MGFSPDQVGRMTPWQFMACLETYGRSQGWKSNDAGAPMSVQRLKDLGVE